MAQPTAPPRPARARWATPGRLLLAAVVVGSFGLWVVALARIGVREPLDTLEGPAFALAAEPVCAAALADVEALPAASTARSAAERSVTIDEATGRLRGLVADLRSLAPRTGEDGSVVAAWLADWDTYLGDRQDYARRLRADEAAEFQLTTRQEQGITKAMDNMAQVNEMPSCATPGDVG
ncbi:MAG: hypothetical protein GEV08_11500 [Acidimicrobiia bacterium]|nr:hypothetical protein [Acidimicrobiia bacterium]